MSSTGAELVRAPTGDEVGAGVGVAGDGLEGDAAARPRAAGGGRRPRACSSASATQPRTSSGVMLSSSTASAPASSASRDLVERVALDLDRAARPARPGPGATASAMPSSGEVVVLEQHPVGQVAAVVARRRRPAPPPSRARAGPGVVLRVSHTRASPAAAASTKRRVSVATPERWHEEVERRALGGEDRRQRARDRAERPGRPSTASPSSAVPAHVDGRVDLGERLGGAGGPASTPSARATNAASRPRPAGSRAEVRSPSGVRSSARRGGDRLPDRGDRRVETGRRSRAAGASIGRRPAGRPPPGCASGSSTLAARPPPRGCRHRGASAGGEHLATCWRCGRLGRPAEVDHAGAGAGRRRPASSTPTHLDRPPPA